MPTLLDYPSLANPGIRLSGPVDLAMYNSFRSVMDMRPDGEIVVWLTTLGGDPEVARAMGEDIRLFCEQTGHNALVLGKVAVYSAGATFMSYFRRENRFLTHGTRFLLHERQMRCTIELAGPLKACVEQLHRTLHELEESIRIEDEGFANLVAGTNMDLDELRAKAPHNWYIEAEEAKRLGLVCDVI